MQITSLYGGPLEFLFVVESTEDPAYHALSLLISDFKVSLHVWLSLDFLCKSHNYPFSETTKDTTDLHFFHFPSGMCLFSLAVNMSQFLLLMLILVSNAQGEVDAKIIVAGLSTTCSQKIHNQLVRTW